MMWVLLVMVLAGFGAPSVSSVEFASEDACRSALTIFQRESQGKLNGSIIGFCVRKG